MYLQKQEPREVAYKKPSEPPVLFKMKDKGAPKKRDDSRCVLHVPYKRETFEGENLHEFRNFTATRLCEILGMPHSLCDIPRKFSLQNVPFLLIRKTFLPRKFPALRYYNSGL